MYIHIYSLKFKKSVIGNIDKSNVTENMEFKTLQ